MILSQRIVRLGKDYQVSAPTAMTNMTEATKKFGGSSKAFTLVPLAGVFFLDLINALIVQLVLPLL